MVSGKGFITQNLRGLGFSPSSLKPGEDTFSELGDGMEKCESPKSKNKKIIQSERIERTGIPASYQERVRSSWCCRGERQPKRSHPAMWSSREPASPPPSWPQGMLGFLQLQQSTMSIGRREWEAFGQMRWCALACECFLRARALRG